MMGLHGIAFSHLSQSFLEYVRNKTIRYLPLAVSAFQSYHGIIANESDTARSRACVSGL